MLAVIETLTFQLQAEQMWNESERSEFAGWIALNAQVGEPIIGAQNARKVSWPVNGGSKNGAKFVVYFNLTGQGESTQVICWALDKAK